MISCCANMPENIVQLMKYFLSLRATNLSESVEFCGIFHGYNKLIRLHHFNKDLNTDLRKIKRERMQIFVWYLNLYYPVSF